MNYSPWGPIQTRTIIAPGVMWVSTASHGGLMVTIEVAREKLTTLACDCAFPGVWRSYVCFEEDCSYAIAFFEQPEWQRILLTQEFNEVLLSQHRNERWATADYVMNRCTEITQQLELSDDELRRTHVKHLMYWEPKYMGLNKLDKFVDPFADTIPCWHPEAPAIPEVAA